MRKVIVFTIFLTAGIISTSCKTNQTTQQKSLLEKSWTHSMEESQPEQFEVFRPTNYKEFPVSRYRQVFDFKDNNLCEYLVLEPNDAHSMKNGKWELDEKSKALKIFNENFEVMYEYEVIELSNELLKLKANNP